MSYSLLSRTLAKSRKEHQCIWCCHQILTGSHYVREISTYDGHFQNFAWHEACRKDADQYFVESGAEEFTSGNEMPFHALYELEASL
ncbi:hypothetical protein [Sinorhizobium meliloti]|uniref:Uncharacterized protein n=1 Tax=Rhizobium meliloti TaxID=382 RepID=A0A6A7ZUP3_RHIML|nr:hypothetical protein [Sinorhizobium meliloti]MQW06623.1 hypothetical protein [Sinorhizobium meliloti]UFX09005.1 hypothetical protein SmelRRI128_03500 [Sinorhizobium meliloti]